MKNLSFTFFVLFFCSFYSSAQVAATHTVPKGHKDIVRNCYFTPNDEYLVSTDNDHVLSIWDGDDGRQIFTLRDSAASFRKVEMNLANTFITALTDSGRLYLIDFSTLKIKGIQENVADYSLHQKEEIIFFIRFSDGIYKYNPINNAVNKVRYSTTLDPVKVITLSRSEVCVEDATKGVFIINEITGKTQAIVTSRSSAVRLHDYHAASGYLLCTDFKSYGNGISYYNIEVKSRLVKGQIVVKGQYRSPNCLYSANHNIIIATNLSEDPDGVLITEPPSLYSFKTGGVIKTLGSEYVADLNEMNLNFSRSNVIASSFNGPDRLFRRFNFNLNTEDIVLVEKYENDNISKFIGANSSNKIAVFTTNFLLPHIFPDGRIDFSRTGGIKKYGALKINFSPVISKSKDGVQEQKMGFLLPGELALNDSTIFTTAPYDLANNLYTGILYYTKNGYAADSLQFPFEYITNPSPGSGQLFWIRQNRLYALDIATRTITDSITFQPHVLIRSIRQAGGNVLIHREDILANPTYAALRYNILQQKIIDTVFDDISFLMSDEELNYFHRIEGYSPSDARVKDYDYSQNTIWEYPLFYDRVDSMVVYDSTGEFSSYVAIRAVPYLTVIANPDSPQLKQTEISGKIEDLPVQQVRFWDNGCYIVMTRNNRLFLYSLLLDSVIKKIDCTTGQNSKLFIRGRDKHIVISNENRNDTYIIDVITGNVISHLTGFFNPAINQPGNLLVLQDAAFGNYYIYNGMTYGYVSSVTPFSKTEYVVNTSSGLFDGTDQAVENLYFLINDAADKIKPWKTIDLKQLKAKYYIPGLWEKLISGDSTDLPDVESIKHISLAPEIIADSSYSFTKPYKIILLDKGGGIGPVRIVINGKEVIADARKSKQIASKAITLSVDLHPYKKYFESENNTIQVFSSNADSSLTSRGIIIASSNKSAPPANPRLFVISIGTSNYKGTEIDLQYSSKDAADIAEALKAGSKNLFSADSTFIYTLTTDATDTSLLPTKFNIERTFTEISKKAAAKDIVVLYLSGHGINASGDFYYLTKDAYTANSSAYIFKEVLQAVGISSNEFTEYLKKVAALKQLLIIDACASGKIVENLVAHRDIPYSTLKALDRLKDRTGTHVITGCAADAVSYEASRFGQGLLTYSLLEGMKGASLRDNKFLDVAQWFQYARERVPQLAAGLGGIQTPQVYSPTGNQSFDIAELDEDGKMKVPLAPEKPVFIKSIFQEEEKFADVLTLGRQLDNLLYETSSRDNKNKFMFFPVDEFPGAYQVLGRYKINGNTIEAAIRIIKADRPDAASSFSLVTTDARSLSLAILGKIREFK